MFELVLPLPHPTPAHVQAAQTGRVRVGLEAGERAAEAVQVLFNIEGLSGGRAPYDLALVPEPELPYLSPLALDPRCLLAVILVDSLARGHVRAMRAILLSARVSEAIRGAVAGMGWESTAMEEAEAASIE